MHARASLSDPQTMLGARHKWLQIQEWKNERISTVPTESPRGFRSWSLVIASLLFSMATYEMLRLYGVVHWRIMFRPNPGASPPPEAVFDVLGELFWLRAIFAVLAFVWAVWSFRACPRWASSIALAFSLLSVMTIIVVAQEGMRCRNRSQAATVAFRSAKVALLSRSERRL